jgi:hypothetical protein
MAEGFTIQTVCTASVLIMGSVPSRIHKTYFLMIYRIDDDENCSL